MTADARLWRPWLRINRVLRVMLHERWSAVAREIGSVYDPELRQLHIVPELFVLDESRLGGGALVSDPDAALFERVLDAISTARSLRQGNETNYHPAQRSRSVTR